MVDRFSSIRHDHFWRGGGRKRRSADLGRRRPPLDKRQPGRRRRDPPPWRKRVMVAVAAAAADATNGVVVVVVVVTVHLLVPQTRVPESNVLVPLVELAVERGYAFPGVSALVEEDYASENRGLVFSPGERHGIDVDVDVGVDVDALLRLVLPRLRLRLRRYRRVGALRFLLLLLVRKVLTVDLDPFFQFFHCPETEPDQVRSIVPARFGIDFVFDTASASASATTAATWKRNRGSHHHWHWHWHWHCRVRFLRCSCFEPNNRPFVVGHGRNSNLWCFGVDVDDRAAPVMRSGCDHSGFLRNRR
mmetsp:Transcript_23803/g.66031  ORF Transcript_23803/g.66031 Transcript_23803/m.66031 type:complete len:304 (+) Transcript_23803:255-1166(+)